MRSRSRSTMRLSAEMNTSMAGCRARKCASRGISHNEANGWLVETVKRQRSLLVPDLADRLRELRRAPLSRVTWRIWPASVSRSSRWRRSNSGTPSCSSSVWICRDSADCVRNKSCAARVNERWRAAASKPFSRSSDGRRAGATSHLAIPNTHANNAPISFEAARWDPVDNSLTPIDDMSRSGVDTRCMHYMH